MEQKTAKLQYWYVRLLYFFYFAGFTSCFSFLSMYLSMNSYSKSEIGTIFTSIALINLISQPVLGYLADNVMPIKKIVIAGMLITVPGAFLLPQTIHVKALALVSILLVAFFDYAMMGLMDSWTNLSKIQNPKINYSVVRGMGSLSSAIAALMVGEALARFGYDMMFIFHSGFMIIAICCALGFRSVPTSSRQKGDGKPGYNSFRSLLQNKKYLYYLLAIFLTNIGTRAITTYLPVILLDLGGNSRHQGIAAFVTTIGIAPVMFLYPRLLKRFGIQRMIAVGCVLTVFRILSISLAHGLWTMILLQGFEAISYGIFQPSMLEYVASITPQSTRALSISIAAAVQLALCGTIGNYVAGITLEVISFRQMYLVFGITAALGFFVLLKSLHVKQPESNASEAC